MLDLGTVKPGTTLYIPFQTFDSNDPSASVTITGLATTDIEVYKNGSATQRASDAGYALLDTDGIDFDGTTGIHGISIDLADNTTADFYTAGAQFWVVIASITVDEATVNFVAATFRIGYPGAMLDTTIATLASQTSFTLTAGSGDDDAYNGCPVYVHDIASAVQVCIGHVEDYTGSTRTITLHVDPGIFTMAVGDNVSVMPRIDVGAWQGVRLPTPSVALQGYPYVNTHSIGGTANLGTTHRDLLNNAWDSTNNVVRCDGVRPMNTVIGDAQGGTSTTIQLEATESFADDTLIGCAVNIISGTGLGQTRVITDYVSSTDTATVSPAWTTTPTSGSSYQIVSGAANVAATTNAAATAIEAGVVLANSANHGGAAGVITLQQIAITNSSGHGIDINVSGTDNYGININASDATGVGANIVGSLHGVVMSGGVGTAGNGLRLIANNTGDALFAGSTSGDEVNSGTVSLLTNITAISGSTIAADNLEESTEAIITGTASGTPTTTVMQSDLTGYADDELIGRTIIWKSGTADGQASDITDYASTNGTVTYTAVATAPVSGDNFVIV